MQKEARVRYIGPHRSGVPEGRMGTLLGEDPQGIGSVSWDIYEGLDCQVTHSCCSIKDLEELTSPPRCERPTRPGMYLINKPGKPIQVAIIAREGNRLCIRYSIGIHDLEDLDPDTKFWGPIEAR